MQFNSLWFIPFFVVVYFANWHVKERIRQIILLSASLLFYCMNGKGYLILFLFLILLSFLSGIAIERNTKRKKLFYFPSISALIGILLFFKYNRELFPDDSVLAGLIMPIGFSFYTFQMIAYLTDIYRGGYSGAGYHFVFTVCQLFSVCLFRTHNSIKTDTATNKNAAKV